MEENGLKSRLLEFIAYLGISGNAFEREVGLKKGYIANKTTKPGYDILVQIHNAYPELNINWLLFNEGLMINEKSYHTESTIKTPTNSSEISHLQDIIDKKETKINELNAALAQVQSKYISLLEKMSDVELTQRNIV